jgi:hypothetical protein
VVVGLLRALALTLGSDHFSQPIRGARLLLQHFIRPCADVRCESSLLPDYVEGRSTSCINSQVLRM